jgi:hypothetical protein
MAHQSGKGCPCFGKKELKAARADWKCQRNNEQSLTLTSDEDDGTSPPTRGQGFGTATRGDNSKSVCLHFFERRPHHVMITVTTITKKEETVCRNQIKKKCDSLGL